MIVVRKEKIMNEVKIKKINQWIQSLDREEISMQDQMEIAKITLEMIEKLEPIYDKYKK